MIDKTTIFLMGWVAARAGQPGEGPPFPCDPDIRREWQRGYEAYRNGDNIYLSALSTWRGTR